MGTIVHQEIKSGNADDSNDDSDDSGTNIGFGRLKHVDNIGQSNFKTIGEPYKVYFDIFYREIYRNNITR